MPAVPVAQDDGQGGDGRCLTGGPPSVGDPGTVPGRTDQRDSHPAAVRHQLDDEIVARRPGIAARTVLVGVSLGARILATASAGAGNGDLDRPDGVGVL
jgi:hypothetical protein